MSRGYIIAPIFAGSLRGASAPLSNSSPSPLPKGRGIKGEGLVLSLTLGKAGKIC